MTSPTTFSAPLIFRPGTRFITLIFLPISLFSTHLNHPPDLSILPTVRKDTSGSPSLKIVISILTLIKSNGAEVFCGIKSGWRTSSFVRCRFGGSHSKGEKWMGLRSKSVSEAEVRGRGELDQPDPEHTVSDQVETGKERDRLGASHSAGGKKVGFRSKPMSVVCA